MSDATNMQAFQTALAHAGGLGATYQPTNAMLDLANMQLAWTTAQSRIDGFIDALIAWKLLVNDREEAYEGSGKLATRVQAFVASCGASPQDIEDMKGFVRKIHGGRAKKIKLDDPNTPEDESKHISVSQRGYSDVAEHWANVIALCSGLGTLYKPNETELKVVTLQAMLDNMEAKNQAVIDGAVPKDNARTAKNNILYDDQDSLFERLKLMKAYLKAAFGADSPEYRAISGLQIKKP